MKIEKGSYGYIHSQKIKRSILTAVLFAIPLVIFFTGLYQTKTRLNMFTFVAIMGCLPASRCATGMFMMLMQKPLDAKVYRRIRERVGTLTMGYELVVTAYEKTTPLEAVALCGYEVVAYTSKEKADTAFTEEHIRKILKGNGYRANVKIIKDLNVFLDRLSSLNTNKAILESEVNFTPRADEPNATRDELVMRVIQAISL